MTVILLRHGRSGANTAGVLAGRTAGVELDDHGSAQAQGVPARLGDLTLTAIVRSPLERCAQTVAPLEHATGLTARVDERLNEVDYGSWAGRSLRDLAAEPLWQTVQHHPSAAVFPDGESLAAMQARAVAAIRDIDQALGPDAVWVACSHGDVIKAVIADAVGSHLDQFQRIIVDTASLSAIRYTAPRPYLLVANCPGEITLPPSPKHEGAQRPPVAPTLDDAVVGGGA